MTKKTILNKILAYCRLMRLDKPVGILLFLWPPLWGLWVAGQGKPELKHVIIFMAGVVIMRTLGCVINDIADRNFDPFVQRTKHRPLATGVLTIQEAFACFLVLSGVAVILLFQLNRLCFQLACLTAVLACLYPFTKRWISCPQLFLGITVSMSIPMAFAIEKNIILTPICALLFLISTVWSFMYDTEYAMVDKPDDTKLPIYSTAMLFGKFDILIIILSQVFIILLLILLGFMKQASHIYYTCLLPVLLLFSYQTYLIKNRRTERCFQAFLNNQWVGFFIFVGFLTFTA